MPVRFETGNHVWNANMCEIHMTACFENAGTVVLHNLIKIMFLITSAFKEYWGQAWADYIVTIAALQSSNASGVPALLVCTALHPQITRRHCSEFSVAHLLIWTSQNSSTVQ